MGFRLELWAEEGTKVGSMLTEGFVDMQEGANRIVLRLDLSHLTTGQYSADLVAFLHDADGNEDILDGVYPGFVFNVEAPLSDENYLDWHHQYWGYVHLADMEVERL